MSSDLLFDLLEQIDINEVFDENEEDIRTKALEKTEKATRRKERQDKRKEDCGNWSYWYNPHSGRRTGFTFKCGLFRDCPSCLERRADDERHWLRETVLAKSLIAIRVDSKQATKLLRNIDKSEYVRYPQENGIDLLIANEETRINGKRIGLDWVLAQNWARLTNTPEGRNKSGTVHLPATDDDMSEFTLITTKQFTTSANRYQALKAMQAAEGKTTDLNPKTPDEVVKALNKRINIATSLLKEEGFTVQVYNKRLKVMHDKIDWQIESDGRIFRVNTDINTKNPTLVGSTEVKQFKRLINS